MLDMLLEHKLRTLTTRLMLSLQSTGLLELTYAAISDSPYICAIILCLNVEFYTYHTVISVTYD